MRFAKDRRIAELNHKQSFRGSQMPRLRHSDAWREIFQGYLSCSCPWLSTPMIELPSGGIEFDGEHSQFHVGLHSVGQG